jgi:hypothetical protein
MEYFDYFMHYIGCPALIIALIYTNSNTMLNQLCFISFALYAVNLLMALIFFVVPLNRATNVALMFPTSTDDDINGMMNDFLTISISERMTYAVSDYQSAIIAQASYQGEINAMVYNNAWSASYNHSVGYINLLVHFIALLVVMTTSSSSKLLGVLLCYFFTWIIWRALKGKFRKCMCCVDFACGLFLCVFTTCSPFEQTIAKRVQNVNTTMAKSLDHITGKYNFLTYFF